MTIYKRTPLPKLTPYNLREVSAIQAKYPHGMKTPIGVRVQYLGDQTALCMTCGRPMNNRSHYKLVKGKWVRRKSKPFISCWECAACAPYKAQPVYVSVTPSIAEILGNV